MGQDFSSLPRNVFAQLNEDEPLRPRLLRASGQKTPLDEQIDQREIRARNLVARAAIALIHAYRAIRPASVGNRCAFEPSCSRFMEVSIEYEGVIKGTHRGWDRLCRCGAHAGGVDFPPEFLSRLKRRSDDRI